MSDQAPKSHILSIDESRSDPLNVLGQDVSVKLSAADCGGAVSIFHLTVPPMTGPPLHKHELEDEWFYVLEGEVAVEVDGKRATLSEGGCAYAERGTVHSYQNFSEATARLILHVSPGASFEEFFHTISKHNAGREEPDVAGSAKIIGDYQMEICGPPLQAE